MKKLTILITVLCFGALSVSNAQVKMGRSLIGVSTSFSYFNYGSELMSLAFTSIKYKGNSTEYIDPSKTKVTTLNIQPRFGYFIADNIALGANLSVGSSSTKEEQNAKYTQTSFGFGPFVRYYISGTKVLPFFELSTLFGSITEKYNSQTYDNSDKSSMRSIGGGAGLAVKVGEKVTFDMMAGYNSMSVKAKQDNPNDSRSVQGTLGFKFGFVVLFGSK
jgi:hypothetical protein